MTLRQDYGAQVGRVIGHRAYLSDPTERTGGYWLERGDEGEETYSWASQERNHVSPW